MNLFGVQFKLFTSVCLYRARRKMSPIGVAFRFLIENRAMTLDMSGMKISQMSGVVFKPSFQPST